MEVLLSFHTHASAQLIVAAGVRISKDMPAMLIGIKLLHTAVWVFFAGCIVAIPFAAALHDFRWVAVLTGLVLFECSVLLCNRGRCPMTGWAAHYTRQHSDNFDIYQPVWLAHRNKTIFGVLFVLGELFALRCWLIS
jgi:hypothetical protein